MLTDTRIKKIKPPTNDEKEPAKYSDTLGLQLHVFRNDRRSWIYAYRFEGKQRGLTIGKYPKMSLVEARRARDNAKDLLDAGTDPSQAKKTAKQQQDNPNTFERIARQWLADRQGAITDNTLKRDVGLLEKDVFPFIGNQSVDSIKSADVLLLARRIEERGAGEMARRVISLIGGVIRQAMREGMAHNDPTTGLKEALKPRKVQNMARIPAKELPELLARIEAYAGDIPVKLGLLFMNLTFVRTKELRFMTWDDIAIDAQEWRIPAHKMKMDKEHIVPLSAQALSILEKLKELSGNRPYVFFNTATRKPYSENAFLTALWRMGYKGRMTGHGFRGLASTILHEQGYMHDAIELQLAHTKKDQVSAAYNHAQHLPYRRQMMQEWANYLDGIRKGNVLQFVKASA